MRISRYCFSVITILCFVSIAGAQEERIRGLRIGYDISRLALYFFEPERKAFELSADFEIKRNFFLTSETGTQKYNFSDSLFNYNSLGSYVRIGLDYNILKNRADNQYEMVFGGLRYGYSRLRQTADNIMISGNYWGEGDVTEFEDPTIHAHWIEAVAGVRAELFKHVFIGWSFRWRVMLYQSRLPVMKPIYIPGYGRGEKKSVIGFNYYVYISIPLGKFPE